MLSDTTGTPNSLANSSALARVRFQMPPIEVPGRSRNALMCSRAMAPAPRTATRSARRIGSRPRENAIARQTVVCERDGTTALLVRRVSGAEHLNRHSADVAARIIIVCEQRGEDTARWRDRIGRCDGKFPQLGGHAVAAGRQRAVLRFANGETRMSAEL